jgi:hypothetical protein
MALACVSRLCAQAVAETNWGERVTNSMLCSIETKVMLVTGAEQPQLYAQDPDACIAFQAACHRALACRIRMLVGYVVAIAGGTPAQRDILARKVTFMGGRIEAGITIAVNVVVVLDASDPLVVHAVVAPGVRCATQKWVEQCYTTGRAVAVSRFVPMAFHGMTMVQTGGGQCAPPSLPPATLSPFSMM